MTDPNTPEAANAEVDRSLRRYGLGAFAVIALLVGGIGGWAATSRIAGAVLSQGTVVVDSNVKKVQHPTGGIVGELKVREGDKVEAGDILLSLDGTATRANLQVIVKQLNELEMRQARLRAERDDLAQPVVPASLLEIQDTPEVRDIIAGERALFNSRISGSIARKSQLRERSAQMQQEISGYSQQLDAKKREIDVVTKELQGLQYLADKNLVQISRVNMLRREQAKLEGDAGQYTAQVAQVQGRISETELLILQIDQDRQTEIVKELREAQGKENELVERRVAAEDLLRRIDLRAPQAGVVHQLAVHTVGGVINPGEVLMLIVPEGDRLVIEARVAQQDIEQVHVGQQAILRMTAFNMRTTPEILGTVDRIAADLTRDQQTGMPFFTIRISISDSELARLETSKLLPGMGVDVQFKTRERTALSYFIKPLTDQMTKAFRER